MICPYCDQKAKFVSSKDFYGKCYGKNLYVCYECDARVGTHGKSKRALGTMANKKLRVLRMTCHQVFDKRWRYSKNRRAARGRAYKWLRETMGLSKEDAHIGKFNENQCFKLLRILEGENESTQAKSPKTSTQASN